MEYQIFMWFFEATDQELDFLEENGILNPISIRDLYSLEAVLFNARKININGKNVFYIPIADMVYVWEGKSTYEIQQTIIEKIRSESNKEFERMKMQEIFRGNLF